MRLDPQVKAVRERAMREQAAPLYEMSLAAARAADLASIQAASGDVEAVKEITETTCEGRRIRIYRPDATSEVGAVVYFFGGGWTLGSIETADGVARSLAKRAGCAVIVPEYRLAPEHPFPAAVHDAYAATLWAQDNSADLGLTPDRIAVAGDSAGGNLAAAVTLMARDAGGPALRAAALIYPNTDHQSDTLSAREYEEPWMFNRHSVAWYWSHYLADPADGANPLASPLRAPDLSGLPPTLVITAEHDPLRDQAEAYGRRLAESGVDTTISRYNGMIHGFFCMPGEFDAGRLAQQEVADFLRRRLCGVRPCDAQR